MQSLNAIVGHNGFIGKNLSVTAMKKNTIDKLNITISNRSHTYISLFIGSLFLIFNLK